MTSDRELLRRYCQQGSEEAFREIVSRHVNLVYGTALRQLCGNDALAQDVTQAVFTALATKPNASSRVDHLSAWLHATTRFTVSHTVRSERRRQDREQKAQTMHALLADSNSSGPSEISPAVLDEVLEGLDPDDREAVLRRFFEGQSYSAIGSAMDTSEDAARMRITRALEKIRGLFARRGITSSAAAVSAALAHEAVAAPAALAASVSATALTGGIAAAATAKLGLFAFMTTAKGTLWLASAAVFVALGYSAYEHREATARGQEAAALSRERNQLQDKLNESERHTVISEQRAIQSAQQVVQLQNKLHDLLAAKSTSTANVSPLPSPDEKAEARTKAKMAEMKPLLEAGMPIKGIAVISVGDKPVDQPVEFVVGRKTRIDLGDDGAYVVTPTISADGSINYDLEFSSNAGGDTRRMRTEVDSVPWATFTLSTAYAPALGFVPDQGGTALGVPDVDIEVH